MLTIGLAMGKNGGKATNMLYINLIFSMAMGKIVFGEQPGLWSMAGTGCVVWGLVWVAREKGVDEAIVEGEGAEMEGMMGAADNIGEVDEERGIFLGVEDDSEEEI